MNFKDLYDTFSEDGKLLVPGTCIDFVGIPWSKHPTFEGVELKHLITSKQTSGEFSYHLVRIAPNKSIGNHVHKEQLETHEVIAGDGTCIHNGVKLEYKPGVISIFPVDLPHEVLAGSDGLYLFAKFMPALN
jgi:quercetin dioxygenase-like cupin family protein